MWLVRSVIVFRKHGATLTMTAYPFTRRIHRFFHLPVITNEAHERGDIEIQVDASP